jgi:hypothetical protein
LSPDVFVKMSARGRQRSNDFSWKDHVGRVIAIAEALLR